MISYAITLILGHGTSHCESTCYRIGFLVKGVHIGLGLVLEDGCSYRVRDINTSGLVGMVAVIGLGISILVVWWGWLLL